MLRRTISIATAWLLAHGCVGDAEGYGPEDVTFEAPTATEQLRVVRSHRRFLDGMNQHAVFRLEQSERGSIRKIATLEDGTEVPVDLLQELERSAIRDRFGAMSPATTRRLTNAVDQSEFDFFVVGAEQPSTAVASLEELGALTESVVSAAGDAGMTVLSRYPFIAAVVARGSFADARALARDPSVASISLDSTGELAPSAGSTDLDCQGATLATTANWGDFILEPFNGAGLFGDGEYIGIPETVNCGIYPAHKTYANATVVHESRRSCLVDSDCGCDGALSGGGSVCLDGFCAGIHHNKVASAVSGYRDAGERGASRATILVPAGASFGGSFYRGPCDQSGVTDMYDWMLQQSDPSRLITNESWLCDLADPDGGDIQDLISRKHGVIVVRAAGNRTGTNVACERSMNSICVGSVRPNNRRSSFSSYDNPPGTDREEPDVMALGTGVEVAACDYEDRYRSEDGTSFAAPSVAATVALFREYCGVDWSPRDIRASFVLAGFGRNAEGTNYSTPFASIDHQDGGGTPDPKILQGICNPERLPDPSMQVQLGELNPVLASDPALPLEIDASTPVQPKFLHPLGAPSSGRAGDAIVAFKTSTSGSATIRVSMSWDGCPPSLSGLGRTSAVPDYDLFLLDKDTGTVVANSVSFDDNIEGFEIEVEQAGTYVLYYGHDRKGCNDAAQEPFTWVALTIGAVEWVDPSSL